MLVRNVQELTCLHILYHWWEGEEGKQGEREWRRGRGRKGEGNRKEGVRGEGRGEKKGERGSHLAADKIADKLSIGCWATLLVTMDKGRGFDGDDRPSEQPINTHILLCVAKNLRTEEKFNKCNSYHHVNFVSDGDGSLV